jgi:hypothetical protein
MSKALLTAAPPRRTAGQAGAALPVGVVVVRQLMAALAARTIPPC